MSTLLIRLLGPPEIERDGVVAAPPRGHKAWAVLAYVVLAERPVARARLAGLIFGDADDPLGALRWTLAQLRRALGVTGALRGDPLELGLPEGAAIDVLALASGDPDPALARGELLEGVDLGAADFDAWLMVERRRFAGVCEGVLRDAALGALAAGVPLDGAALASRALALNRFDDGAHELLVRCLARAGDVGAARDHVDACDVLFRRERWTGRRDHAVLLTMVQTGLRVSELTGLTCTDVTLTRGPHLLCHGKGRKERVTPLTPQTAAVLRVWQHERAGNPDEPLFPTSRGGRLSSDAVTWLLAKHVATAAHTCASLDAKTISPHVLRHTSAMRLLHAGVDITVIALWLGHESTNTTHVYLHADLALKERALARTAPPNTAPGRYRPPDQLLAFLESL